MINPVHTMMDGVEWIPTGRIEGSDGRAVIAYEGFVYLGDFCMRCFLMSNGTSIIDSDELTASLGFDVVDAFEEEAFRLIAAIDGKAEAS